MLIIEDTTVTEKCRTAIKVLFLFFNFNLCLHVMLESLSCSFTSISFLTIGNWCVKHSHNPKDSQDNLDKRNWWNSMTSVLPSSLANCFHVSPLGLGKAKFFSNSFFLCKGKSLTLLNWLSVIKNKYL